MGEVDDEAVRNLRLIEEIEANRAFILQAYAADPQLLARADPEIRRQFDPLTATDDGRQDSRSMSSRMKSPR